MNELERFMRDVESDEDLAERFGTVANRIARADDTLSEAEVKARAMSKLGYKVTATDLELAAADAELLDHHELDQVAGGTLHAPGGYRKPTRSERGEISHCWGLNEGCYTPLCK